MTLASRRIPFTPAIYEHSAKLIGHTPWQVSRDLQLLIEAQAAAYRRYRHQTIVVGIDIYNLEAEAYGAKVINPQGDGIPAIHEPLISSVATLAEIKAYDPARDGRIPMVIRAGQELKKLFPEADIRIPVAGPVSIAVNLRGITSFCEECALEPEKVKEGLHHLAENQGPFCEAIVRAGLDVAFFESAAAPPLLSPRQFRALELPALKRVISIAESHVHHAVPCIMGGDTYKIFEELMSTGTGFVVCNVETDQKAFVARAKTEFPKVKIRVNMDPGIVACPDHDRIEREIDRVMAIIGDHPGCLIGTGALPFETPPENVDFISRYLGH